LFSKSVAVASAYQGRQADFSLPATNIRNSHEKVK